MTNVTQVQVGVASGDSLREFFDFFCFLWGYSLHAQQAVVLGVQEAPAGRLAGVPELPHSPLTARDRTEQNRTGKNPPNP